MALSDYKIQPGEIASKGVIAAPDKLTGTAAENKAVFDRLIREVVAQAVNGLVDGLTARTGAGEIGAAVSGLPGTNVQALLNGLKQYIDESVIDAGAMVSFNGRNGRVIPQTGDYTADQITETGKHFITPSEREKWNEAAGALQYHNAGVHNSIYRGKPLGSTVTAAQYAEIAAGTFKDLYIGDYWTIGGVNYRIAAFDYYLGCGDTACTQHHAVIVPDSSFYSAKMNETNTTEGGYTGSLMAREGIQAASNTIHTAFSGHILYHRVYLVDGVTGGHPSSGVWRESSVRLMTEQMVYGGAIYMPIADGSAAFSNYRVEKSQLPLFAYEPSRISNGSAWWLRDVVAASSFAYINATGGASYLAASNVSGIRPVFSIC